MDSVSSPKQRCILERYNNSRESSPQESLSPEKSPFRGFEKIPTVLLTRINIEPFLKQYESSANGSIKKRPSNICKTYENINKLSKLEQNCTVRLVRDNLEQLKQEVIRNSRLNKRNDALAMLAFRCKICEKTYNSEKKLQNHLENKHMLVYKSPTKPQKRVSFADYVTVHELREYHRCRKCPKIFEDYKSLKTHVKHEHKKRKCYVCHYCSKSFVERMIFKVHIKLHCDACGLLFPNKRKYSDHRRQVCRIVKKYECKTCHNLFFSFMDLKDHNYDHLESLFICDVCKEQCGSKCEITHHISFLHSDRRPRELYTTKNIGNEILYLCNFCDTSSIDREVIDDHVSGLPDLKNREWTGYKDFYFCDQCSRRFDTETSMVQHKWTHFLKTCDNSQIQQKNMLATPELDMNRTCKIHDKLPRILQPRIVLQRIDDSLKDSNFFKSNSDNPKYSENPNYSNHPKYRDSPKSLGNESGDKNNFDLTAKKAYVNPKSKTTNASGDSYSCDLTLNASGDSYSCDLTAKNTSIDPKSKTTNASGDSYSCDLTANASGDSYICDLTAKNTSVDPKSKTTNALGDSYSCDLTANVSGDSFNCDLTAKNVSDDPKSKTTNALGDSNNFHLTAKKASVDPKSKRTNESVDGSNFDLTLKKAYIDPKSKKTLLSRFQCKKCNKYYSSNYCLNRHILRVHTKYSNLQCPVCEETFVWPSLLQSHKCIRMNIPEMPFDDARAEIQLQDYSNFGQAGFDDLMTMSYADNQNYMNAVDFEIPAPIVELIEYENCANPHVNQSNSFSVNSANGYKIVVQEVPIEF